MAGIRGNIDRVGADIVEFLEEVSKHFRITIVVTSGFRSAEDQAKAMFKYWKKLERGKVYSKKALPEADRKKLDQFFKTCFEDETASAADRTEAKSSFLELAKTRGPKSKHLSGRAVDIVQSSLSLGAYQVISRKMRVVREGKRRDIHHCESVFPIARVTGAEKKCWGVPMATACTPSSADLLGSLGGECFECS